MTNANETKVLDHGYVRLVESWGSDERIIEAARMSTSKGFEGFEGWGPRWTCPKCMKSYAVDGIPSGSVRCPCGASGTTEDGKPGDEKLLAYLFNSKPQHSTPFEMAGLIIEVQAPIFVFREWHRHRTQSYNEASARYAPLPHVNYMPTVERLMRGDGHLTKQAGGTGAVLTEDAAQQFRERLGDEYLRQETEYQVALSDGVPKELARLVLPLARYSRMRASANLRNWLGFLTLRADPKAQWEIQQYAHAVHAALRGLFPRTLALFDAGRA